MFVVGKHARVQVTWPVHGRVPRTFTAVHGLVHRP